LSKVWGEGRLVLKPNKSEGQNIQLSGTYSKAKGTRFSIRVPFQLTGG
jgi:hypothetical protein